MTAATWAPFFRPLPPIDAESCPACNLCQCGACSERRCACYRRRHVAKDQP